MNRNSEKDGRDKEINDVYAGKNPVAEELAAGVVFDTVFVTKKEGPNAPLIAKCVKAGATVKEAHPAKLDALSGGAIHQGIVAVASSAKPAELDDIFKAAEEKGEPALILIADDIQDPHNLGALIRSAECAGAHGVIVPKHRSAMLGGVVAKSSAGAVSHIPIVKVGNLVNAMKELKQRNVWIYGADMDGGDFYKTDLTGASAIVIGSEGEGIGRLVKQTCDGVISIPMSGKINSLNASVAGGILLFEAAVQRKKKRENKGLRSDISPQQA